MIESTTYPDFAGLAAALERQAKAVGEAKAELTRTGPAQRWRRARLLWPLFAKGKA